MPGLSAAQLNSFDREGYLVVENVLDPAGGYPAAVRRVQQHPRRHRRWPDRRGHADMTATKSLPFPERLIQVCMESGRVFSSHFDISLPQKGVKYDSPMHHRAGRLRPADEPALLDVVESVVGPEIYSNPVQHIRTKLPPKVFANGASHNGLVRRSSGTRTTA